MLGIATHLLAGALTLAPAAGATRTLVRAEGWTDLPALLVRSDGSRSLGTLGSGGEQYNATRDSGSKIVYFDAVAGDNATAEVYWWDGSRIVDSAGEPANAAGAAYGTDPLRPDLLAIKPFQQAVGILSNSDGDLRLRSHGRLDMSTVAGNYPDWFLFRRGQTHAVFEGPLNGGRGETEPMVAAAYGPESAGRAVIAPGAGSQAPFSGLGNPPFWMHMVLQGLDIRHDLMYLGAQENNTSAGKPASLLIEDCRLVNASLVYMPKRTTVRRSVVAFRWDGDAHNQGYYTAGFEATATFEESFFYRNGYKTDPRTDPDPKRDIFSRNVYAGGGAQMGHVFRGVLFADGASGGPQMRLGGLIENSLILEGYWFSATNSNSAVNPWLTGTGQAGRSAQVRNNVQWVYAYPTPMDPDPAGASDNRAQPGNGYSLLGASFGSLVESNIVSYAMLADDLGLPDLSAGYGLSMSPGREPYQDGKTYTMKDNVFRGNIAWRARQGLSLPGDWTGAAGCRAEDNVFVSSQPIGEVGTGLSSAAQMEVRDNRFYASGALPTAAWMGSGNTLSAIAGAAAAEGWPDPDRTLKRYVTEVLKLTFLDWQDDPGVTGGSGVYDPTGMKTFMAVAFNMRKGGANPPPASGKPSWTGDYAWDARYTAQAVVDWVRAGFGLPPAGTGGTSIGRGRERFSPRRADGAGVKAAFHDLNGRFIGPFTGGLPPAVNGALPSPRGSSPGFYVLRIRGDASPAD